MDPLRSEIKLYYYYYIYEFCPLPDPDVGPSIFVCDVEHTSFNFGMCGRKFVLCFCACLVLCTYVSYPCIITVAVTSSLASHN